MYKIVKLVGQKPMKTRNLAIDIIVLIMLALITLVAAPEIRLAAAARNVVVVSTKVWLDTNKVWLR